MALFKLKKQAGKKPAAPENLGFLKKEKVRNCPVDQAPMVKKTKYGITIDKCEKCSGIWLDKGEIESIALRVEVQQRKYQKQAKRRD